MRIMPKPPQRLNQRVVAQARAAEETPGTCTQVNKTHCVTSDNPLR